jgi:hypothetical protein
MFRVLLKDAGGSIQWNEGFAPKNGHRQRSRSRPKSADTVAEVESRSAPQISRKLIFGRLCGCVAFQCY